MANTQNIMSWNANGLLNHQQDIQATLDINKIDVCLISETHFTKQSFIKLKKKQTNSVAFSPRANYTG
jgi:exonuclease III